MGTSGVSPTRRGEKFPRRKNHSPAFLSAIIRVIRGFSFGVRVYALLRLTVPAADQTVSAATFSFRLHRPRRRAVRRREGR